MRMKSLVIAATAIVVTAGIAMAQDPIADRKAAMKSVGGAAKAASAMLKGEMDYDAAKALEALTTMNAVAKTFGTLFPEGTETGGETTAKDTIWSDRAGFDAAVAKFEADTAAGVSAAPADLDAFKVAFGAVGENCGACHKVYRIPQN